MHPRQRFFFATFLSVILGIALAAFALLISKANSKPIDLTENRRFTLADQSQQAVTGLKEPVKVWAFVDELNKNSKKEAESLLERYQKVDPAKFKFELSDPERSPMLASKFQIKIPGPAVIEVQQADKSKAPRYERINTLNEDELTNGLLKLSRNQELKIYALTGHGEKSLDPTDKSGLGSFKADLAKEGFILEELNLAGVKEVPADAKALIMAGPKTELIEAEKQKLDEYLKKQGRLLLMVEPESAKAYQDLVKPWGLELPEDVIIDFASQYIGSEPIHALALILDREHPITKALRVNLEFRLARPVLQAATAPKDVKRTQLASTKDMSFTVPAADVIGKDKLDIKPPETFKSIPLAQAVSIPKEGAAPPPPPDPTKPDAKPPATPEARVVVVGDADFVNNVMIRRSGNRDFALNTVNWLAETENQISIRPRDPKTEPLRLTQADTNWMLFWHVLAIPFAVAGMGFISVMMRRR